MSKEKKLVYNIVMFFVGMVLFAAATAAYYSHGRIGEMETTIGEAVRLFSPEQQQEYELMQTVRMISILGLVVVTAITAVLGIAYYRLHENQEWEVKKGLMGGLVLFPVGAVLYYFKVDLFTAAIAFSLLYVGVLSVIGNSVYLLMLNERTPTTAGGPKTGKFCSDCGSPVSSSDSYCSGCGGQVS